METHLVVGNIMNMLRGNPAGGVCCAVSRLKPVHMEGLQSPIAYAFNGISFPTCSMMHSIKQDLHVYQLGLHVCGASLSLPGKVVKRAQQGCVTVVSAMRYVPVCSQPFPTISAARSEQTCHLCCLCDASVL